LTCRAHIKVLPSFLIKGTTLTLPALVFIMFAYESSDLTWRDLPEKFCAPENRIAHSTLYRAVHSVGEALKADGCLEALGQRYLPFLPQKEAITAKEGVWPPPKSLFSHTQAREQRARHLLCPLLPFKYADFVSAFYRYVDGLSCIFSRWKLPKLYPRPPCNKNTIIT
jgi:hypothetical protein